MVEFFSKVYKTKIGMSLLIKTVGIGCILLIGLIVMTTVSSHISNHIYQENQQIEEMKNEINSLIQSLIDQETGQRGYNLTGDVRFLQPYNVGTENYDRLEKQITVNIKNYPELVTPVNQMIESGYYWHNYYGATQVELQRKGDTVTAVSLLDGKHHFDKFRKNGQVALDQAEKYEAQKFHQLNVLTLRINLSLIFFLILLFIILVLMILQAFKQVSEPILEVREAVKEMAKGNFDYPLPRATKRRDELSELVSSLKLMRYRLERLLNYTKQLAEKDGLTGVYNRRILDKELVERVSNYHKNGQLFSIILLDIDRFKGFNDTYGHSEGDRILQHVARVVSESVGETDLFARFGGEEFMVVTFNKKPKKLAEHLRKTIKETPLETYPLTASFGVAMIMEGDGPKELIDRADDALYRAKSSGRNRVEA